MMKRFSILIVLASFALAHSGFGEEQSDANKQFKKALSKSSHTAVQQNRVRAGNAAAVRAQTNRHINPGNRQFVNPNRGNNRVVTPRNNVRVRTNDRVFTPRDNVRVRTNDRVFTPRDNVRVRTNDRVRRGDRNIQVNRNAFFHRRFSNWNRHRHDRNYWRGRYTRFAIFGGGYYYWNNGYWYPAYGYDPYFSNYVYDAPIYGYNNLEPQQVMASVQSALQQRGYDPGSIDGVYGPDTRNAILDFQQDNGLEPSGVVDSDTLSALGLQ